MIDESRRAQLLSVKLSTLVREHLGGQPELVAGEFGGGAALTTGAAAWVLLDGQPERGLGAALAWALRRDVAQLHVLAERATGLLARRAEQFTFPISVWHVEGRSLLPALAEPLPESAAVPAAHDELRGIIIEAGATPVVEHGVLAGEVEGLEVCRVVTDAYTDEVRLEVGVGAHDREAFMMLHGNKPTAVALAEVVQAVSQHRQPGAPRHPLNMLAQERSLRERLVAHPDLIGAATVVAVEPPLPRPNLKDAVPCVALANIDGEQVAVVCSSGVDLDLVPYAVDARAAAGLSQAVLVVPARDALDAQHRLAALVDPPLRVVTVG
jgi:hypothetical protein